MHRTRRLVGCWMAVVLALVLVAVPAVPAAADHAPPGPVEAGTGSLEGTEKVLDEKFLGHPCFQVTRSVFALRGVGTYHGRTAAGQEVVYRAQINEGGFLYRDGPLQVEVENTQTYYHGPLGTHGTTGGCGSAGGDPVPAEFRIFAADHVYRLDDTGAQVPCKGDGSFARGGMDEEQNWYAEWTLREDCVVVGNQAGTPGTGTAPARTAHTHHGLHTPCSGTCVDNFKVDYTQYLPIDGPFLALSGPASAPTGKTVTVTARVTEDAATVPNVPVTFSVAGPAPAAPPGATAATGADGRATFTFTASVAGDYTVSAAAIHAGQVLSATHTVTFTPPEPLSVSLAGPTKAQTEDGVTVTATVTRGGDPAPAAQVDFTVTGPGQATPPSGSAITNASGRASFAFTGDRAGDYVVTASATHLGEQASAKHTLHLDIRTIYREDALALAKNETRTEAAVIDPAGNYAYFGTSSYPWRLVKVDLNTFERVGAVDLENAAGSGVIDPAGRYAYLGIQGSPARVAKVDLTTFQRVGTITLNTGENSLWSAVIDPAGNYAYFGTSSNPGRVVKVDLARFERVGALTFEAGEITARPAVMDPAGRFAYFGTSGDVERGRVVKIDLATFQRVGAVDLEGAAENRPRSAVIDSTGNYAYFGTQGNPTSSLDPGRVVKVDLKAFARVGAITLAREEIGLYSAVIDPDGRHAYFGTGSSTSPGRVVRVDLTTFERAHAATLAPGEADLRAAVIDPDGSHAYFGTSYSAGGGLTDPDGPDPGKVIKVALTRPPKAALVAGNDAYSTPFATPLSVPAPGVLANDRDTEDNDPLTAHNPSDPAHGSVALNPDGSFTYTPDEGFSGTDTFTYTASDGMDYSAPATVSVAVGPPPQGVSSVKGSAYGYYTNVSLFGGPYDKRGPAPAVELAANASNSPQDAHVDSAEALYGPAVIFKSGPIDVHAKGAVGPSGYATSSSTVKGHPDPNQRPGPFLYDAVSATCSAKASSTTAIVGVTNGVVETSYHVGDDPNTAEVEEGGDPKTTEPVPANPPPGYTVEGTLDHVGDRFRIVFNEQTTNPDGSRTLTAAHMYLLGPTAVGDVFIAQPVCGVSATEAGTQVGDFDGNGTTDIAVFRPSNGAWYVKGAPTALWGTNGDIPVPADYDGNGTTDIAVFRPSNGAWYVKGAPTALWGTNGDIPVPADYDGNGTTDMAVFRPSNGAWYVKGAPAVAYGTNGDVPVVGDYDGNGKADMAVFRPSNGAWYVKGAPAVAYGTNGDVPVPADYDGNGKADMAVFRPSNGVWYVKGAPAVAYGTKGDIPVVGDYDGNGKADTAVFRPSNGVWYVKGAPAVAYGTKGDVPAPLPPAIKLRFF